MLPRLLVVSLAAACTEPTEPVVEPTDEPQQNEVWIVMAQEGAECHDHVYAGRSITLESSRQDTVTWQLDFQCGSGERQIKFVDPIVPVSGCTITPEQSGFDIASSFHVPNGETAYITCGASPDAAPGLTYAYRILDSAPLDGPSRLRLHALDIEVVP